MNLKDAEARLGFPIRPLVQAAIPVETMLQGAMSSEHSVAVLNLTETKEEVFKQIRRYLRIEGYPTDADPTMKDANINDLVYAAISPILEDFVSNTSRQTIQLMREKEIVSIDCDTGGEEEFVVVDQISNAEGRVVVIIEAKRTSVGPGMKQCLLSMKDARDRNKSSEVYGFVTTGETWRTLKYDGNTFSVTRKFDLLFEGMIEEKEKWMKDYSIMVECMWAALTSGGL